MEEKCFEGWDRNINILYQDSQAERKCQEQEEENTRSNDHEVSTNHET